jgi:high affinity Mn2+ porin
MQAKGTLWNRPKETFGLAEILDGIGHSHRDFLAAGGLGPLISDGQLPHYALENVVETHYDAEVFKGVHLGVDYQFVSNPGYNPDRGPIHISSARLHFEF